MIMRYSKIFKSTALALALSTPAHAIINMKKADPTAQSCGEGLAKTFIDNTKIPTDNLDAAYFREQLLLLNHKLSGKLKTDATNCSLSPTLMKTPSCKMIRTKILGSLPNHQRQNIANEASRHLNTQCKSSPNTEACQEASALNNNTIKAVQTLISECGIAPNQKLPEQACKAGEIEIKASNSTSQQQSEALGYLSRFCPN